MKLVLVLMYIFSAQCSIIRMPEYLQQYSCSKSDPEFEKCIFDGFSNTKSFFLTGIPELGVPPLDPFRISSFSVNRTLNHQVRIDAVCNDVEVTGLRNTIINGIKADPINHYGEMRLTIPWAHLKMEYDVKGQLFVVPLESKGHFEGHFNDTQMVIKGNLKTYTKDGVDYFKVGKLNQKITIGSGEVKLLAKDKDLQYLADFTANFFNDNPRRVLDAINPIFIEFLDLSARQELNKILARLPASEWLPE